MPVAFFDFDGTLTREDSFLHFIRYVHGDFRTATGVLRLLPLLLKMKLGVVSKSSSKESVFSYFFKGFNQAEFESLGYQFSTEKIPQLLRPVAINELEMHKKKGSKIVIVSASFSAWLKPWCQLNNFDLLATEYEVANGYLTGKFAGKNCQGVEKVNRIREQYNLDELRPVYAYGNSPNDWPMLELADYKWMKWKQV